MDKNFISIIICCYNSERYLNYTFDSILKQTYDKYEIVIVDDKKRLLGTLTDGDLRGSILSGKNINESIAKIYNSKPTFFSSL